MPGTCLRNLIVCLVRSPCHGWPVQNEKSGCESNDPVITVATGSTIALAHWDAVEFIALLNPGRISDEDEPTLLVET